MGAGTWSAENYAETTQKKIQDSSSFKYTATTKSAPRNRWSAHPTLDPLSTAGQASPFQGKNIRESRDTIEHPNTVPIAVIFDISGSMGAVPVKLQQNLAKLFSLIRNYVKDPQILIGAYGDTHCDNVPLQMGQFESDNRIDDALDNLFLEGGGGGNAGETPTLAWYFLAEHTATDLWDKNRKKGYAFTIGDEKALPVTKKQIKQFVGDDHSSDLTPEQAVTMAAEKWHLYHLVVNNSTAVNQESVDSYTTLLGDHCIVLQDDNTVAEIIAGVIGMNEGVIDLDNLSADLNSAGSANTSEVRAALATVGAHRSNNPPR